MALLITLHKKKQYCVLKKDGEILGTIKISLGNSQSEATLAFEFPKEFRIEREKEIQTPIEKKSDERSIISN